MTAKFERPKTLERAVLSALRDMILVRRLKPGQGIPQDAIADELGVSKLPVREALKILEGEGQVTYRPHRGYVVAELNLDELLEIYRMRELLEEDAVKHAAHPLGSETLSVMKEAMDAMDATGDGLMPAIEANRRFHFSLLESTGRPQTVRIIRLLWDSSEPYRALYYMSPAALRRVSEEHVKIYEAAAAGETDELLAHLRHHRESAISALKELLPQTSEGS